jgi:CheY-like chemotaxis protein
MKTTLNSLLGTYQILLMTINRCTDYTITSHGLALTPTYESVNLLEAIAAPVSCVRDLQGRIDVELEPLEVNVSTFITTDRQWLQDNLLCLVSNGVKFSVDEPIKVRVYLTNSFSPDALNSFKNYNGNSAATTATNSREGTLHVRRADSGETRMIRFEVEDYGVGLKIFHNQSDFDKMSVDDINELKKLFQVPNLNKRRVMGGSGLGLHCLSNRVEALHGEYGVRPRKDGRRGSLFWFAIPYIPMVSPTRRTLNSRNSSFLSVSVTPTSKERNVSGRWFENAEIFKSGQASLTSVHEFSDADLTLPRPIPVVMPVPVSTTRLLDGSSSKKVVSSTSVSPPVKDKDIKERDIHLTMSQKRAYKEVIPRPSSEYKRDSKDSRDSKDVGLLRQATENHAAAAAAAASTTTTGKQHMKPHILVVDDSLPIVKMLKIMLEKNGFAVTTAGNGLEGVQEFQKTFGSEKQASQSGTSTAAMKDDDNRNPYYDGILMDIQMPVMDGIEAVAKIRELEKSLATPVPTFGSRMSSPGVSSGPQLPHLIVAMSAGSDEETREAAFRAGADEFLPKPFNLQSFQRILQDYQQKRTIHNSADPADEVKEEDEDE